MAEYTLTLQTKQDYSIIKKLLKAFKGATIRPANNSSYTLEKAYKELQNGEIVGPFNSTDDFMKDLLS